MRLALLLLLAAPAPPGVNTSFDVPYAEPKNERQLLDIYAPAGARQAPVVLWVHGGGWMAGHKRLVDQKPAAFTAKGYVFVSINYRFIPHVKMEDIVRDVARATGWVHRHIGEYGGNRERLFLMGHSAGAQLVALLATDHRYLAAEKVPLRHIRGCVPVDGDTYDVPLQVATAVARRKAEHLPPPKWGHPEKFGDLAHQRDLSAVTHIAPHRPIPPFLILHVASHPDTSAQAWRLWSALDRAGYRATLFAAENSDHMKLDRDLGVPADPATEALFAFAGKYH